MENGNQPATKADLTVLDSKIDTLATEVNEKLEVLRGEMNHNYADLVERFSDGQTALMKAFYSYAQGNNKRSAELEGNEGAFRSRLATMEDRLLEVEKRLNMPPRPQ
jgi:hypothetical protein